MEPSAPIDVPSKTVPSARTRNALLTLNSRKSQQAKKKDLQDLAIKKGHSFNLVKTVYLIERTPLLVFITFVFIVLCRILVNDSKIIKSLTKKNRGFSKLPKRNNPHTSVHKKLGSEQLENKLYDNKKDFKKHVKPIIQEQMFVCSTFVAWVLYNSVDSIHQWFDDHKIDYEYITPSDLSQIEGVEFLFSSTWTEFDEAAEEFAKVNEEFADYLPVE